jgi:hypothetical protein
MKLLLALLPVLSAFAEPVGYLKDFDYQVASYDSYPQAYGLEKLMSVETRNRSICSNRAHVWAYDLARFRNIKVGKVFLHFTDATNSDNNNWTYHVAPYVIVNGKEMVMDPVFYTFGGMPISMGGWTEHFAKTKNCVVLDPINHPEHLKLERFNLADDTMSPDRYSGGSRLYPSNGKIKCYIRKVPMYYQYPAEVYGVDLYHSGKTEYASFERWYFDEESVLNACQQAMNLKFKMKHSCEDYLRN